MLYSDYAEPQVHVLPEIEAGSMVGRRSRAISMDSQMSSYSLTSEQPMQLFNLSVLLNNSMKNYALPDGTTDAGSEYGADQEVPGKQRHHVSKFRKHLNKVMQ